MYKRKILIILLIFMVSVIHCQEGKSASKSVSKKEKKKLKLWLTDFDKAKKEAKKTNKPVFILFTGSDWCSWCKKLQKEVLMQESFKKYAKKNIILLEIDFPSSRKRISPEILKKNYSLKKTYGVRGFPTIIITDLKGKRIGIMSYMRGGPVIFIKELKRILSENKKKQKPKK